MKRDDYASGTWIRPKPGEIDQRQEDVEPGHPYYKLVGRRVEPIPETDGGAVLNWAMGLEHGNRRVARTEVADGYVSTVFMGINHNFGMGAPQLFETMVFRNGHDEVSYRCTTYAQAEELHRTAVETLK
jgi:hypothetical protein